MLQLATRIARRYLLSRRLPGPVNVISWIALAGVALGTAALVIVLSVFNGFSTLIAEVFQEFDPHLKVVATHGQYMQARSTLLDSIRSTPGVDYALQTLEGRALLRYHQNQRVIQLKGVPHDYRKVSGIDHLLDYGVYDLRPGKDPVGIVAGGGVAYLLNAQLRDYRHQMELVTVSPSANLNAADEDRALNKRLAIMTGIFSIQKEYDDRYVLAPLQVVEQLLEAPGMATAIEVRVQRPSDVAAVQERLQQQLGAGYRVLNAYEQHETLYQVMKTEKAVGFLLIALMLLLYCTNIVGSLSMVVIEKRQDIGILQVMGANASLIRRIFLMNGLWIGIIGGGVGLLLGYGLSWTQEYLHVVRFPGAGDNLIIQHYPIETRLGDAVLVALTVVCLALVSAWYPAQRAARSQVLSNLQK